MLNSRTPGRTAAIGLLTGLALVIHVAEAQLPIVIPGIKLGISNGVFLVTLALLGWREALTVTLLRIVLASIFEGNMISFMCSLTGGLTSSISMIILHRSLGEALSMPALSIVGAIMHNLGQLAVVGLMIRNERILFYAPILLISAIATGFCIGILANLLQCRLEDISLFKNSGAPRRGTPE